ncbi:ATPase, T2SS/T4P/T4SS family [Paracoccus pantotrophus]|uniref:ATPase, T2SS/T4P/T4SS family n=1 Tax=Paracoccus pantotrophus TaxID=82367 RepID=UPI0008E9439F|nr:ATPase, T2SS/T4P/T4SS family [Paracoccus pantotrophus]MDF3855630.1 ATPase, T2SS/T4P/T4SS family [Paracoccus pantotrophus]SFP05037.1 type IV secretion system protein VirB11 [Paracoccus pantotrophus]
MNGYLDHYLAKLDGPLTDPATIELAINSDALIWVEKAGAASMKPLEGHTISVEEVTDLAKQIANVANLRLTDSEPMISTTVTYKGVTLRVQAMIPPASFGGTCVSIRLFRRRKAEEQPKQFTVLRQQGSSLEAERLEKIRGMRELVEATEVGALADKFLERCVREKLNIIISGGTSTGKTELARRLQWMIEDSERLVLIEDSAELLPHQPNHVSLIASRSENSPRSAEKLLQATLRLRPDRIILGELRGAEAMTFLESINTGHAGSFTTIHAETARKAMDRLAFLVLNTGIRLNYSEILRYLRGSIDMVIQTGRQGNKRGIMEVYFPALDENLT